MHDRHRGYSLIELAVAISLIALLGSLAVPPYQRAVRKTHRSGAIAALVELHLRQEKYRADNAAYATALTQLGTPGGDVADYYSLSVAASSATSYTLRADARSTGNQDADAQGDVSCARLEIDQGGTRTPAACWR